MSSKESKVLESSLVYDGYHKIEEVEREHEGDVINGEVIKKGQTVSAVIYNTEKKKYIFVEQYKVAADGVTVEIINGSVGENEKPQQTIKRLVTELTGYKVEVVKEITNYYMDTNNSDEVCSLYYVEVNEKVIDDLDFDGYKLVEVEKLGLDAKSLIAVMWVENNNILKEVAELITNAKIRSL